MNIDKGFEFAKTASKFSDHYKFNIGAVIMYKHGVLSIGYNIKRSHPLQKLYNRYRISYDENEKSNGLHAEMMAISHLDYNLSKCSIFVYREHKDGSMAIVRPCKACMKALKDKAIKDIYYTTENGYKHERIGE